MAKRAIILAGGLGTRLRPYTVVFPKPMMPIGEYPILEVIIRQLAKYGFTHITLAVNHQADIIKAFFGDGKKWQVKIDYSLEEIPLGTMGPLKIIPDLPENFLVMNGDILTDLNFSEFYDYHVKNRNIFTISSFEREVRSEFGVLNFDELGKMYSFQEKPVTKYNVSMGIYMVSDRVLPYISEGQVYGFDNLMLDLIQNKNYASVKKFDGYWLDIGRGDDYLTAIDIFKESREAFIEEKN